MIFIYSPYLLCYSRNNDFHITNYYKIVFSGVLEQSTPSVPRPRFRKRDKVLFYGRKMLRKVRSISGEMHGTQGRKRRMVMRFARKLLQLKKDNAPVQLKVLEPPAEFLQEDLTNDERVPPDALYMLQSIRVFGHFEKPVFLKLCKHTEIINLPAGSYLFKIGKSHFIS